MERDPQASFPSVTVVPLPATTAAANTFAPYCRPVPPPCDPLDAAAAAGWTITLLADWITGAYSATAQLPDRYLSVVGWGSTPSQALQEMLRLIEAHGDPQP